MAAPRSRQYAEPATKAMLTAALEASSASTDARLDALAEQLGLQLSAVSLQLAALTITVDDIAHRPS